MSRAKKIKVVSFLVQIRWDPNMDPFLIQRSDPVFFIQGGSGSG